MILSNSSSAAKGKPMRVQRSFGLAMLVLATLTGLGAGAEPPAPTKLAAKGARIGLVYADCNDPTIQDPFHRKACATFADLARRHPDEIAVLTDPDVTPTD